MTTAMLVAAAVFLPLLGVLVLRLLPGRLEGAARWVALVSVLATMVATLAVVYQCRVDVFQAEPALSESGAYLNTQSSYVWFQNDTGTDPDGGRIHVELSLGLDGLSLWLFAIVPLLTFVSVLVGWNEIRERPLGYYSLLLLLQTAIAGVFAARDIILFYVFFEATLVPLYFLIALWGGGDRKYAAAKFFLYTFAGSIITLLGIMAVVLWVYDTQNVVTFSIETLTAYSQSMPFEWQFWIFLAMFAGFAVKVPLFPFHTWLPSAYVQAPTAITILLSGLTAKMGTYGFARFNLAMLPEATEGALPWMATLATVSVIYGAGVALAQRDIKRMLAYSSFSHLGFCLLGLFAMNTIGLEGAVLYMVAHALSSGGMFALLGMLHERYGSDEMAAYGGLAGRYPLMWVMTMIFVMAAIGLLPGLSGFAAEFLVLLGAFQTAVTAETAAGLAAQSWVFAAPIGIILGAWYMLSMVHRVFFGPESAPLPPDPSGRRMSGDLHAREVLALAPMVGLIFWIGMAPQYFLEVARPATDAIIANYASDELEPVAAAEADPVVEVADASAR
jgi:NADH-quinone oxidoreductase subunit M